MGQKLKIFILTVLAAIALVACATKSDSTTVESQALVSHSDIDVCYFDIDTPDLDLNLPRQISGISNAHRVANAPKRTGNWHKNNFEFVKGNKVINVCVYNFIHKESLNNLHRFVKSASLLISLGKLVI